MNSIQLAQRLGRNLAVPDAFNLPSDALLDVLSAANSGIACFYAELPPIYKRTTISATLKKPVELNVVFESKYSNEVGPDTFSSDMFGCTVRLGVGPVDNVVTGPATLLDDWIYDTLAVSATVYFDAVPFTAPIHRIIDDVRLYPGSGARPRILRRYDGPQPCPSRTGTIHPWWSPNCVSSVGVPSWYRLNPVGQVRGGSPPFLMNVSPLPNADFTMRFEAELGAQRLTFKQMSSEPVELAVRDDLVESVLVPLCEAELVSSPFWRDEAQRKTVLERYVQVMEKAHKVPANVGTPTSRIGTPVGY
jgi:hypothetical protein